MKNLLFLIGRMQNGGSERVICNLCNTLKDKYNITLVVRTIDKADYIPDVDIIEIKELGYRKKTFKALHKLRKIKKEKNIDISVSFLLKYNLYNYFSKYKDKIIFSTRNYESLNTVYEDRKYLNFLYKKIIKKVDLIVNVSNEVMKDQIDNFNSIPSKNIVIPNFVLQEDLEKYKNLDIKDEYKEIFKSKVVISYGRYNNQKGQWHAIRAFKKVIEYDKDAKLVLTGRGPLKDYYIDLINKLNLNNNVFILDFVDYRYMHKSYLYLLNSSYEGLPNVILEAMACELPVISTDSKGGSKEIIGEDKTIGEYVYSISKEKYGILIPVCDNKKLYNEPLTKEENLLADSIIMLLKDKKLYNHYKKMSKLRVKDFSKEKILKMWMDVL